MARISAYIASNPDTDVTVAAQLAIWLAQDETPADIGARFPFTPADERLARTLIAQTPLAATISVPLSEFQPTTRSCWLLSSSTRDNRVQAADCRRLLNGREPARVPGI